MGSTDVADPSSRNTGCCRFPQTSWNLRYSRPMGSRLIVTENKVDDECAKIVFVIEEGTTKPEHNSRLR